MVDTFSHNGVTSMIMAGASEKGRFTMGNRILSGLAPMPYLTGLIGLILNEEYGFDFMPPRSTLGTMSFSARSKYGLKQAMSRGMDYFLSMGSVAYYLSLNLSQTSGGKKKKSASKMPLPAVIKKLSPFFACTVSPPQVRRPSPSVIRSETKDVSSAVPV